MCPVKSLDVGHFESSLFILTESDHNSVLGLISRNVDVYHLAELAVFQHLVSSKVRLSIK